jgi:putative CocE/NonD family hydrolase
VKGPQAPGRANVTDRDQDGVVPNRFKAARCKGEVVWLPPARCVFQGVTVRRTVLALLAVLSLSSPFALRGQSGIPAPSEGRGQAVASQAGRGPAQAPWPLTPPRRPDQGADWVRAHYTKQEVLIPMRDGVKLFTAIYSPRDTPRAYPILMTRTPYSVRPYGENQYPTSLGPAPEFADDGFIFVYQDVRGAFMSQGTYVNMRPVKESYASAREIDETTDTYDTVDWLVKHLKNTSGKVGQYGISYPGFYTAAGMVHAHPALVAVSPQAPVTNWFGQDDFHHNGALWLPHCFGFFAGFGHPRPEPNQIGGRPSTPFDYGTDDGYQFYLNLGPLPNADKLYFHGGVPYWTEMMAHDTNDAWWQAQNLLPHLKDIRPAVLTVGGWFDAQNLYGALQVFYHVQKNSPKTDNHLVMGPWYHGGWGRTNGENDGAIPFGQPTSEYFVKHVEQPFFDHYLKGTKTTPAPVATVFETGANQWHQFQQWPPASATAAAFYLRAGGQLSMDAPRAGESSEYDEYVSDPAKPVPFMDVITQGMPEQYMVADQRFAGRRTDVLVYETDVLQKPVTVAGPVSPRLWVSTSGTDSDFAVKLIDVFPDRYRDAGGHPEPALGGYQMLVRGDLIRGKFRNSLEKPEPFAPGQPTAVNFTTSDVYHTFLPGHRIMVQIQSTWFPLADRNPQRFENIHQANASDFQKATERVYHTPAMASQVEVLILPQAQGMR